jgi:kinesin family protein 5
LDNVKSADEAAAITGQTRELIRSHLAENQENMRDLQERLRMSQEEGEMQGKRRGEVEKMLARRDMAYEELLGGFNVRFGGQGLTDFYQTRRPQVSKWL